LQEARDGYHQAEHITKADGEGTSHTTGDKFQLE